MKQGVDMGFKLAMLTIAYLLFLAVSATWIALHDPESGHLWILEPSLPDQWFIPAHENSVSFVGDHKYFSCTALLLQAPVCLRVKIVGRLCLKILILRRKACLPRPD